MCDFDLPPLFCCGMAAYPLCLTNDLPPFLPLPAYLPAALPLPSFLHGALPPFRPSSVPPLLLAAPHPCCPPCRPSLPPMPSRLLPPLLPRLLPSLLPRIQGPSLDFLSTCDPSFLPQCGGQGRLLRLLQDTSEGPVADGARAVLGLMGYTGPVGGRGIRLLTIDGGGVR